MGPQVSRKHQAISKDHADSSVAIVLRESC